MRSGCCRGLTMLKAMTLRLLINTFSLLSVTFLGPSDWGSELGALALAIGVS